MNTVVLMINDVSIMIVIDNSKSSTQIKQEKRAKKKEKKRATNELKNCTLFSIEKISSDFFSLVEILLPFRGKE